MADKKDTSKQAAESAYKVHESVVISLARKAIEGIPGFVRFSGSSIVSELADLVGGRRHFDKSVVVTESGNDVSLEILIVAAYGSNFAEVAAAVQKAVYHLVADVTGLNIKSIDVVVTDTEDVKAESQDEADVVEGEVVQ